MLNTSGGCSMHRPTRRTNKRIISYGDRKETVYARTLIKLGEERVQALKHRWASMKTGVHGHRGDGDVADGIIICLKQLNLSNVMIRSFIPVGGTRLARVDKLMADMSKKPKLRAPHAFNKITILLYCDFMKSLNCVDRFPCSHRPPKRYVISNNNTNITWKEIYAD